MELDFTVATKADCNSQAEVAIKQGGICHGWLGWFDMRLADEWLSTSGEPEPTHCRPWLLAQMTGEITVGQLAIQLQAQFPAIFSNEA